MIILRPGNDYVQAQDYANLSGDQQTAVDTVMQDILDGLGGTFFLTGPGGVGKSFVVKYLREHVLGTRITAMTGVAAQLIGGTTIHSAIGWKPKEPVPKEWRMRFSFGGAQLVVIDEISMMGAALFDAIHKARQKMQSIYTVLLVGDFLQLPPVSTDNDPQALCFKAEAWPEVRRIVLRTQHRQTDPEFIATLNDMRLGKATKLVRDLVAERGRLGVPEDVPLITPTNAQADDVNRKRLAQLPGPVATFDADLDISHDYKPGEEQKKAWHTDTIFNSRSRMHRHLELKVGAKVMCLMNDYQEAKPGRPPEKPRWFNGSVGVVEKLPEYPGDPIMVRLDSSDRVATIEREPEEILNAKRETEAVVTQYPLKLAWGNTAHKMQGQTLERAVIDLTQPYRASGQKYVAFSRVRSKEGLYLKGDDIRLIADPECLRESGESDTPMTAEEACDDIF